MRFQQLPIIVRSLLYVYVAIAPIFCVIHGCTPSTKRVPLADSLLVQSASATDSRVLMQGFYWDCFNESGNGNWWDSVSSKIPALASAGITEIWLPPAQKSYWQPSMGYDPYDYYDLGEYKQLTPTVETYFGSRAELENLIDIIHKNKIKAYADLVYNHTRGGESEFNPNINSKSLTSFKPLSGKYEFHYNNFHPSTFEKADPGAFGADFPDLCHTNPATYKVLEDYSKWLKTTIGYDGFRYDWVNGIHPWVIKKLQTNVGGFAVCEYWEMDKNKVLTYLKDIDNSASVFDFPLFNALKNMCNSDTFDMKNLKDASVITTAPDNAVTFIANHDTDKEKEYQVNIDDKMMAYAYILTHEGVPMVFWKDYYNYGLALPASDKGIDRLLWVRHHLVSGPTSVLYADDDVYVMQRDGTPGVLLILNDNPKEKLSVTVTTKWANTELKPYAYGSSQDVTVPPNTTTDRSGKVSLSIPARGYIVYAPY
jgi:alpha-amylase